MDPIFFISLLISKFINTFFHEMGHAWPALKFTEGDVNVNVGSYNDFEDRKPIYEKDRLKIYFSFNVLIGGGYCQFEDIDNLTMDEYILIVLGGPLGSLFIALIYGILYLFFKDNFLLASFLAAFFFTAFLDFIINILPVKMSPVPVGQGIVHNDGYQLKELVEEKAFLSEKHPIFYLFNIIKKRINFIKFKRIFKKKVKKTNKRPNTYEVAQKLFDNQEYTKSILELEKLIKGNIFLPDPFRLLIDCYMEINDFDNANKYHNILKSRFELDEKDNEKLILIKENIKSNN
jgi:hypothetical protein